MSRLVTEVASKAETTHRAGRAGRTGPGRALRLCICMVGLPARGKSFMARKVASFASWLGHSARIFNVGNYRRKEFGASHRHDYFDAANEAGVSSVPSLLTRTSLRSLPASSTKRRTTVGMACSTSSSQVAQSFRTKAGQASAMQARSRSISVMSQAM